MGHEDWYSDAVDMQRMHNIEKAGGTWVSLTLDSGAGASVFPYNLPAQDSAVNRRLKFATATGERISSGCDCRVEGVDSNGRDVGFRACRAPVANALISVG